MKAFICRSLSIVLLMGISALLSLPGIRSARAAARLQRALYEWPGFQAYLPESGSMRPIL